MNNGQTGVFSQMYLLHPAPQKPKESPMRRYISGNVPDSWGDILIKKGPKNHLIFWAFF